MDVDLVPVGEGAADAVEGEQPAERGGPLGEGPHAQALREGCAGRNPCAGQHDQGVEQLAAVVLDPLVEGVQGESAAPVGAGRPWVDAHQDGALREVAAELDVGSGGAECLLRVL